MELYRDILIKCLSLRSANIAQDHWMALKIPLRKTNTGRKSLFFLGLKVWSKINPSIKNVKTSSSFMLALKTDILLHLQTSANSNNYHIFLNDTII